MRLLELHIQDPNVQTGSVPISWCVDRQVFKDLADGRCRNPHLLIVIAPLESYHPSKEVRKVVPLKDLMTYVDFSRPGPNRVYGLVVGSHRDHYLRRSRGRWDTDVLKRDGSGIRNDWTGEPDPEEADEAAILEKALTVGDEDEFEGEDADPEIAAASEKDEAEGPAAMTEDEKRASEEKIARMVRHAVGVYATASLDVTVPKECFAKEPPAWEQAFVNLWHATQPVDQCSYRRRRLFSYFVKSWLCALIYVCTYVPYTLFLLLIGARGLNFSPLRHPISQDIGDMWDKDDGTVFVPRWESSWRWAILPLMPLICIPVGVGIWLMLRYGMAGAIMMWTGIVVGALLVILLCVAGGFGYRDYRKERREKTPAWYLSEEEQALLACAGGPRTSLKDLPASRRTIRLRFLDLKAKVCRPFAH